MNYFVFKLNIQPNILLNYIENNELKYFLYEKIPLALQNVLQVEEISGLFKLIPEKTDDQSFNKLFKDLEDKTTELLGNYNQILSRFIENHDIHYSEEFLKLNEICIKERSYLERTYPGITKAYESIRDEEIDAYANIESNSKVGTGIRHLRKFYKLKLYLERHREDNVINPLNLTAYYNPNTEHILVESSSETAALNYINTFVELVNGSRSANNHIGKININPVYESISFEGEFSEISFTLVYPNGNPPLDRYNILKNAEAKEIQSKLIGPDGKPLKKEPIQEIIENQGKQGYLKFLTSNAKKIYKKIKTLKEIDETS